MARGEMLTVFAYDVSDDRRRRAVSKMLEEQALRVQYSVFEARMTRSHAQKLSSKIESNLQDGDSLRVYVIGSVGQSRTRVFGDGPDVISDENYWLL